MAAASHTRQEVVRRHTLVAHHPAVPASATLSRRESATVALDAVSLTETTVLMALAEEAMVVDTRPVDVITAERPALASHSSEESAREARDAVTITAARVSKSVE